MKPGLLVSNYPHPKDFDGHTIVASSMEGALGVDQRSGDVL